MSSKKLVIAIDGPAGAGKSTVARIISEKLAITYIDSGAMYRAITWFALKNGLCQEDKQAELISKLEEINIRLMPAESVGPSEKLQRVFLNEQEITRDIRKSEITSNVSYISAIPEVRKKLVALQQAMGEEGGVIMDGRDIGSTVFPQADLKVFLIASAKERALRRQRQLIEFGESIKGSTHALSEIQAEIEKRDQLDSNRKISPLKQAEDAILLCTDSMKIEEVVDEIIRLIKQTKK
jgi:cytidylate kinase